MTPIEIFLLVFVASVGYIAGLLASAIHAAYQSTARKEKDGN